MPLAMYGPTPFGLMRAQKRSRLMRLVLLLSGAVALVVIIWMLM